MLKYPKILFYLVKKCFSSKKCLLLQWKKLMLRKYASRVSSKNYLFAIRSKFMWLERALDFLPAYIKNVKFLFCKKLFMSTECAATYWKWRGVSRRLCGGGGTRPTQSTSSVTRGGMGSYPTCQRKIESFFSFKGWILWSSRPKFKIFAPAAPIGTARPIFLSY